MALAHNGTDELEQTARRVADQAKGAVRRTAAAAQDVADDAMDAAEAGYATARDKVEDALSWAGEKVSALGDRIQEKPLQTAAIALAAGAAIAWLMRR